MPSTLPELYNQLHLWPKNSSWRYHEVDSETFSVVDSVNFYTKLNDIFRNGEEQPTCEFEYSTRNAYDPAGFFDSNYTLNATFGHYVAEGIKSNVTDNQMYTNYESRNTPYSHNCAKSTYCANNYCYIISFTFEQYQICFTESG